MKTSTINTIITSVVTLSVGILGTLGVTSSDSSKYSTMYEEIKVELDELKSERDILNAKYEDLKSEYETLESKYNNLKKQYDGSKHKDSSTSETQNSDSTIDSTIYLMKDCPPYEGTNTFLYNDSDGFKMSGNTYSNGFTYGSPGPAEDYYILFNLSKKYTSIEFDFGHIDGSSNHNCSLTIYRDGDYYKTIEKSPDELVTHESIDVSGIQQLKLSIVTGWAGYFADYGFGNITAIPVQ